VADPLGAEQAPAGGEAGLPQRGQVSQPLADPEVARVIDRGFRSDRFPELVVLLDHVAASTAISRRSAACADDAR
jgi:hypothetical protein